MSKQVCEPMVVQWQVTMVAHDRGGGVRRLPIVFVVEASERLGGVLGVTLQQGLETLAIALTSNLATARMAYMAAIVFNQSVVACQRLTNVHQYAAPSWQPARTVALGPALDQLASVLRLGLIQSDATQPGDLPPLIFFVLGWQAEDDWRPHLEHLRELRAARAATMFALIPSQREAEQARTITPNMICLDTQQGGGARGSSSPADLAARVTTFFDWVAQVVVTIAESSRFDSSALTLPPLPEGLIVVA